MEDGEYIKTKHGTIHRVLSALVFATIIAMAIKYDYFGRSSRVTIAPLIPVILIWFPDALSSANYDKISGQALRWFGWATLLLIPSMVFYIKTVL